MRIILVSPIAKTNKYIYFQKQGNQHILVLVVTQMR